MNLYRFLLHSSWVAIALAFLFPTSIKNAEAKTLTGEQKTKAGEAGRGNNIEVKQLAKPIHSEAAKLGGIASIWNCHFSNYQPPRKN